VPSGLAVRPAAVPQRPDVVALPVDPDWISVVVAVDPAGRAGPPPAVQARIEWLLGALPPASVPLRVVATHPGPPALLARPVGPSGAPLHVLTPNGPAVPSPAATPPAAPAALSTVDGVGAGRGGTLAGALTVATVAASRLPSQHRSTPPPDGTARRGPAPQ